MLPELSLVLSVRYQTLEATSRPTPAMVAPLQAVLLCVTPPMTLLPVPSEAR